MRVKSKSRPHRRNRLWLIIIIVIAAFLLLYLFLHTPTHHVKKTALPVVLAEAKTTNVPITLSGLGSVVSKDTITVRTQINGQLLQVLYKEGQMVKAGDLLAQIDPRPYEAQLTQFIGQLERDKALLANAKIDVKRYKTLWKQDSVSKQVLDTQTSLVHQLEGTVKFDQGQIDSTKLNLLYCKITAPVSGRVGLRLVDQGNYVQTSDTTGIVVINTINPITVVFSIPEDNVPQVMEHVIAGKTLEAKAYDRAQDKLLAVGTLLTVDNQIDPTTGTVKLKAQFQNENNLLFPNQFVNIRLLVDTLENATVVPTAAIQQGSQGTYVYLATAQSKVKVTPVVVGPAITDNTVIKKGLFSGQSVVVEGADKLTDGAVVKVATANPPAKRVQTRGATQ